MNNGPSKTLRKYAFGRKKLKKQTKIVTHMDI